LLSGTFPGWAFWRHSTSLGQGSGADGVVHSVEGQCGLNRTRQHQPPGRQAVLLLFHHPQQVFLGEVIQRLQLPDPVVVDLAGSTLGDCIVQEPLGFLDVAPRDVQRVFESGLVLHSRILFHASIVVPFPGRFQSIGRERSKGGPVGDVRSGFSYQAKAGRPAATRVAAASLAGNDGGFTPAISSMTRTTWQL
jgi:hypothetical protein